MCCGELIPQAVLSLELLSDFGLCDVFTLYNDFFCWHVTFDHLQDSKSLNSPLDFLTIKSLTVETMVFAGNMFIENNGEEANLKDLQKKDRRDFWSEFLPDIDETRKTNPALEVFVLQTFCSG